jgi:hypothetical protein
MNDFTQLIFFISPAILVAASVYMVLNKMIKNNETRRNFELQKSTRQATIPIRLQAYERFILLLERISPDSLVVRTHQNNMNCQDLHLALLAVVREEFEHNLSQQLYISIDAWATIKAAKESIVMHINESAAKTSAENPAIELARLIVESYVGEGKSNLILSATDLLKNEAKKIF